MPVAPGVAPGRPMAPGGFGPPPGGGARRSDPTMQARLDLQAVLNEPQSTSEQIQEKLAALRKARQQAKADLAAAQQDLLELLTMGQQAILASLGLIV